MRNEKMYTGFSKYWVVLSFIGCFNLPAAGGVAIVTSEIGRLEMWDFYTGAENLLAISICMSNGWIGWKYNRSWMENDGLECEGVFSWIHVGGLPQVDVIWSREAW